MSNISKQTIEDILLDAIVLTNDAFGIFDAEDKVVFCNYTFCEIFAHSDQGALGDTFEQLIRRCFTIKQGVKIDASDIEAWLQMAHSKRRSAPYRSFEVDTCDQRWYRITEMLVGEYMLTYCTEITASKHLELELLEAKHKLQQLAATDYLTGIYNRREFNKLATQELERAERSRQTATLLLLDIDHFKQINDTYGHACGDAVLVGFTDRVRGELRSYDVFARVGGEEFAILLPETSQSQALVIAQRCLNRVSELPFYFEGEHVLLTVSIGMSTNTKLMNTLDDLLKCADKRLYFAKQNGRDQICYHL